MKFNHGSFRVQKKYGGRENKTEEGKRNTKKILKDLPESTDKAKNTLGSLGP